MLYKYDKTLFNINSPERFPYSKAFECFNFCDVVEELRLLDPAEITV